MNDKNIEYSLIKIYRRLGLLILSSVYKDISVSDLIWLQQLMIINDILIHSYFIIQNKRIFVLESVLSTLSTYYTPKYTCKISVTIDNIIKDAIKMYKDGSEHSHIQMIEYFKKKKKYADYFSIRGFERNLKSKLKRVMKDNNINKIEGDGYYRKGYKRPRKKKEDS